MFERDSKTQLPTLVKNRTTLHYILNVCNAHFNCVLMKSDALDRVPQFLYDWPEISKNVYDFYEHVKLDEGSQSQDMAVKTLLRIRKKCKESKLRCIILQDDPDASLVFHPSRYREVALMYIAHSMPKLLDSLINTVIIQNKEIYESSEWSSIDWSNVFRFVCQGMSDEDITCSSEHRAINILLCKPLNVDELKQRGKTKDLEACIQCSSLHRRRFPELLKRIKRVYNLLLTQDMVAREAQRIRYASRSFPILSDNTLDDR